MRCAMTMILRAVIDECGQPAAGEVSAGAVGGGEGVVSCAAPGAGGVAGGVCGARRVRLYRADAAGEACAAMRAARVR